MSRIAVCGALAGLALAACDGAPDADEGVWSPTFLESSSFAASVGSPPVPVALDVAEGALSVTLGLDAAGRGPVRFGVRDGAGRLIVDPARPEFSPVRMLRGRELAVGLLTAPPGTLLPAGRYEVWGEAGASGEGTLHAWVKRSGMPGAPAGALPTRQTLALHVFVLGPTSLGSERVRGALATAVGLWTRAGIAIDVAAVESFVPGSPGELDGLTPLVIDATLGSDTEALARLLRLSVRAGPGTLPVFVVDDVLVEGGGSIWALSAGVPVPPVLGTVRSGIVVSGALLAADGGFAGQVIAHEIGHALGLFHTTESRFFAENVGAAEAPVHDGLEDTPACPAGADRDGDRALTPEECASWDSANLMFWAATPRGRALTAGQGDVARRHPLTR